MTPLCDGARHDRQWQSASFDTVAPGEKPKMRKGWVMGCWGLHRTRGAWAVRHLPSRRLIKKLHGGQNTKSERTARQYCEKIVDIVDSLLRANPGRDPVDVALRAAGAER